MTAAGNADPAPAPRRPLQVGLGLDTLGLMTPDAMPQRWPDLLALARRAEEAGFDSLWIPDHLILRTPERTHGAWEGWSLLAAIAAVTTRSTLGTIVLSTSFRNPALLAKMADTVDEISGGRLILGLGAGWHEPEYTMFGFPFDHRASRFEEAFTIIRSLLREGRVDFAGRYYQARECELRPRGPRPQGPPLLVGTRGERMLRLTAEGADLWNGWLVSQGNDPALVRPFREALDAACAAAGRDPSTLVRTVGVRVDQSGAGSTWPLPPAITGTPEAIAEALRAFAREGIAHLQVLLTPTTLAAVEAFVPVLEHLDRG